MSTNTYLIIGGIAIVFIAYLLFLKAMMKKRTQKQLEEFDKTNSGAPLTEFQKRLLAFGGILSYHRGEKILGIKPETDLNTIRHGLNQQWEITNSTEAKEVLNNLVNLERSTELDSVLHQPSKELNDIKKEIASGLSIDRSIVEQVNSTYAWDTSRATSLAKWCYWVGYITEDEAWQIMQKSADVASTKGTDWSEYTISFLLGRTIQGFDLDEVITESGQLYKGKGPSLRKIEGTDVYLKYPFKAS